MPEPTLFDAINTAIETDGQDVGGPSIAPDDSTAGEDTGSDDAGLLEAGDDQDAGGSAEGDDQGGEPRGEDAEGDQPEGEGEERPGFERDPVTGKFVKKDEPAKPGDKPGEKPGDKGGKKPDHVNDPIPRDLKPATQERMRFLVNETKKMTEERNQVKSDFDFMVNGIKATGTTVEQYGEILSFMAMFNSGDPAQQEKALETLEGMADRLATSLGKERSAADPLAGHADLKADVAAGKITAAYAKQLAVSRNRDKFNTETRAAHDKSQRDAQALSDAIESARTSMNTLEDTLAASDPDFAKIKAQIIPVLTPLFKDLHPSKWEAKFKAAYTEAKKNFKPAPRPRNPTSQPMRGGRSAGGGGVNANADGMSSGGGSLLDAVNAGIAAASRR